VDAPATVAKRERRAAAKAELERRRRRDRLAMRVRAGAIMAVIVLAAVALVAALGREVRPTGVRFAGDLRVGGTLTELRLPELEGGGVVEYARYADRPLIINFFASWCPSCIAEMPDFERVHAALGGRVAFLGVSQGDAADASIDLARETGITYDTAIDQRGEFFRAIGGIGMPTTIFVRPGGQIADVWVGALNAEALLELIHEHFDIAV
jgi:thiol-disulfide isomerase/thioredoxin